MVQYIYMEKLIKHTNGQWSLVNEELEKSNKINYSIQHHATHPPGKNDDPKGHGGATFKVHALSGNSKVDPSNHVGTVETDKDGQVTDSDFHSSVPKHIHDHVHNYVQENHEKIINKKRTQKQKV